MELSSGNFGHVHHTDVREQGGVQGDPVRGVKFK